MQKRQLLDVDSIRNQTYRNVEAIIIDDGSKDTSKEIVEKYIKQYELDWISVYVD